MRRAADNATTRRFREKADYIGGKGIYTEKNESNVINILCQVLSHVIGVLRAPY
jgi:hypothetical protein